MKLSFPDLSIIVIYIAILFTIGIVVRRRAARGVQSYFLGSRELPWWMLAMSGSSSYFDITGTMWIVSLFYIMGLKGMWVQWIWGFPITVFFAAYMGKWINRSNVMTAAEWMKTRFGIGKDGEAARLAYTILAVVTIIGFLGYCAVGMGKFGAEFLPFSQNVSLTILMGITGVYIIFGGFYGVVFTEFVQTIFMSIGAITVAVIGFIARGEPSFQSSVNTDWFSILPRWEIPSLARVAEGQYYFFGLLTIIWVMKGMILCLGGPEQLFDFQRFLSAKNPRDASKLGALWGVIHTVRWPMAMAITVLSLSGLYGITDPETVLPAVINKFLPIGLKGLALSGLLAAFMASYNSMINAGASYLIRDLYQQYIRPQASQRELVIASYGASTFLVLSGIVLGTMATSINQMFSWIMVALGAGVLLPNFLRWYWWRMNGWGFTAGTFAGIAASIIQALFFQSAPLYVYFPVITLIGFIFAVGISYATRPTDEKILVEFYTSVQPSGLWKPIFQKINSSNPRFQKDIPFLKDFQNVILGLPWLICMWLSPMYLIVHKFFAAGVCFMITAVLTIVLYFTWYKNLPKIRKNMMGESLE